MIYNYDNEELHLKGLYKNQSCFIIVGGPSLNKLDLSVLNAPGIITLGVNNAPKLFRPNMWISVDDPQNFMISIWKDPKIQKFVMHGKRNKPLWDNTKWRESALVVNDCPNVFYYKDNEHFKPTEEYLTEDTFNWGNHTDRCECGVMREKDANGKKVHTCHSCGLKKFGSRSVLLAAVKLTYFLGFRQVFIVGADFKMSTNSGYAWEQNRSESSIKSNNETYDRLNERFSKLRPVFEKNNFFVFNATPDSKLNSFIKVSFSEAVKMAASDFPETKDERTFGMYERRSIDKRIETENIKIEDYKKQIAEAKSNRVVKRLMLKLNRSQEKFLKAFEEKERLLTWKA